MAEYYQQGDVLFIPRDKKLPKKHMKVKEDKIVAEGEATGHMHRAIAEDATVYVDKDGEIFLSTESGTDVTHQEHHTVSIPKGDYDIKIVREYDPLENEVHKVRD